MSLSSEDFLMGMPLSVPVNPHYMCYIIPLDRGMDPIILHLPEEYSLALGASYQAPFAQGPKDLHAHVGPAASAFGVQFANKAMTMQLWQGSNDMEFSLPLVLQIENDPNADVLKPLSALYELVLPRENIAGGLMTSPGPHLDLELLKQGIKGDQAVDQAIGDIFAPNGESALGAAVNGATGTVSSFSGATMSDATANTIGVAGEGIKNTFNAGNRALANLSNTVTSAIKYNIALMIGQFQFFPSVVITNVQQDTKVRPDSETGTMSRINLTVSFRTFYTQTNRDLPSLLLGTQNQWNETTAAPTETQQRGNESNAVQQSPSNTATDAEKVSMMDALGGNQTNDPVTLALNRNAWG